MVAGYQAGPAYTAEWQCRAGPFGPALPRATDRQPPTQKSICALSFTNRGDKTDCGVSHEPVGEYVWL